MLLLNKTVSRVGNHWIYAVKPCKFALVQCRMGTPSVDSCQGSFSGGFVSGHAFLQACRKNYPVTPLGAALQTFVHREHSYGRAASNVQRSADSSHSSAALNFADYLRECVMKKGSVS